jgi:hypothetical protein
MNKLKPNNIQIELVRGCNLACDFCAIHCLPKEKSYMDLNLLLQISKKIQKFEPFRIELAMRGEPLLHPEFIKCVNILNHYNRTSQITVITNGIKLTPEIAIEFFQNGGNIIAIDCYNNTYDLYKKRFEGLPVYDFYQDKLNPWYRHNKNLNAIILMDDIGKKTGDTLNRIISNQAGNVDFDKVKKYGLKPMEKPLIKKCASPFRELVVLSNGNIPLCCKDWKETLILGNVKTIPDLDVFWNTNPQLIKHRLMLYNKFREFLPCRNCDYTGGARLGLLPKQKILSEQELKNECNY